MQFPYPTAPNQNHLLQPPQPFMQQQQLQQQQQQQRQMLQQVLSPHQYLQIQMAKGLPDEKLQILQEAKQEVARTMAIDDRTRVDPQGATASFHLANQRAIPGVLTEHYMQIQYKCFMGVFPEINRVWVTFDEKLFLWKYDDDKDFVVFEGLGKQVIVSVGLVRPKPDIFVESVEWLIVITTAVEVAVLAVSFDLETGEMLLQPTSLSVPSDDVNMLQVTGTSTGRIFMCGRDGHLYELDYKSPSWFSRQCKKRNHSQGFLSGYIPGFLKFGSADPVTMIRIDESRQILYTLSQRSTIQVFYMGVDGQGMSLVATRSQLHKDRQISSRIFSRTEFDIVAICPVTKNEDASIHLVAVTSGGVRVYFTTMPIQYDAPYTLEVKHVDLPVGDLRNRNPAVHSAYFSYGSNLMAASLEEGADTLYAVHVNCVAKSLGSSVEEGVSTIQLPGKVWCISEKSLPSAVHLSATQRDLPRLNVANELVTQHLIDPRQFLCLTNQGLFYIEKSRPVDELRELILHSRGQESRAIDDFFLRYGDVEACSMCLLIAADLPSARGSGAGFHDILGSPSRSSESLREWALTLFLSSASPTKVPRGFTSASALTTRYDGFSHFLARLLRPVWTLPINRLTVYSKEEVENMRDGLANLQSLVQQTQTTPMGVRPGAGQTTVRVFNRLRGAGASNVEEQNAFECLLTLLARAREALSLLLILNENDVMLVSRISPDRLAKTTFSGFVCSRAGVEITTHLLHFLIHTPQTELISEDLARSCPQFFNETDLLHFRAIKRLNEAARAADRSTRDQLLAGAMDNLRNVSMGLSFADVSNIIEQMKQLKFWRGIVEVALLWVQSPANAQSTAEDDNRRRIIMEIMDVFGFLLQRDESSDPTVVKEKQKEYNVLKDMCMKRGKKELLEQLFLWYLEQGKLAELKNIHSAMLEEFLKSYDAPFLATYYMHNNRLADAAATYAALAESRSKNVTLSERMKYLGLALGNLKAVSGVNAQAVLDLQEKQDVASIQQTIYNQLKAQLGPVEQDDARQAQMRAALNLLDTRFFTISELYNEFADTWSMLEVCLYIIYKSNHDDPLLVKELWRKIFARVQTKVDKQPSFNMKARLYVSALEQTGKKCMLSFKVFPVDDLCQMLEAQLIRHAKDADFDGAWVPKAMIGLGIPHSRLFDVYQRAFRDAEDRQFQVHLSIPLRHVVSDWMRVVEQGSDPSATSQFERKRIPFHISEFSNTLAPTPGAQAKAEQEQWTRLSERATKPT